MPHKNLVGKTENKFSRAKLGLSFLFSTINIFFVFALDESVILNVLPDINIYQSCDLDLKIVISILNTRPFLHSGCDGHGGVFSRWSGVLPR